MESIKINLKDWKLMEQKVEDGIKENMIQLRLHEVVRTEVKKQIAMLNGARK